MDGSRLTSGHPWPVNRLFSIPQQPVDLEEFGVVGQLVTGQLVTLHVGNFFMCRSVGNFFFGHLVTLISTQDLTISE